MVWPFPLEWPTLAVYQRIRYLARRYEVTLLTRRAAPVDPELARAAEILRPPWSLPQYALDYALFYIWALFRVLTIHRQTGFRAIYTFQEASALLGFACKRILGTKWVSDIFDDPALELSWDAPSAWWSPRKIALSLLLLAIRRSLRSADLTITIGETLITGLPAMLVDQYEIPPSRILPVPNGVDLQSVKPQHSVAPNGARPFRVIYVGTLGTDLGTFVLLRAFDKFHSLAPTAWLSVVGSPVRRDRDEVLSELAKRTDYVSYPGPLHPDRAHELIEQADICVYPFLRLQANEGTYPVKVFEYLALGKPVVATRLQGVSQIVRDGENGLLIEPGSKDELASALHSLYSDFGLKTKLSERARASVERFDWSTINAQVGKRLDSLL